ncbi:MAG: LCP family protein [Candidatus Uhrbacteria bacterium]|nr:LCP family protein [Candidatus Uhrbacteria bacterium]
MDHPKIDFLKEKYELVKPDEKPFLFFRKTLIASFLILAIAGAAFSFHVRATSDGHGGATELSLFSIIRNFILPGDDALDGESDDRVNFLLTGVGGTGHEGAQLTDTILFASYRPSTKKLAFLSLPRDMTVPIPGHGYQKVNHVNAYAEAEKTGSGGEVTAQFIGNTIKQPVQYYMRVDFGGFQELIDTVGGVDVTVDHAFTDAAYPIIGKENDTCGNSKASMNATAADLLNTSSGPAIPPPDYACRFEVLTFKEGVTHMDGKTALAFVRSRHGNNGEGSDFARSHRQQKIMLAVKDKVFSASTFLNPVRITGIFDTLQKNISTNLSVSQLMRLAKEFKDLKSDEVVSHVIDDSPNSPLYATMLNGAYVLLPKNDDWTTLQQMAQYIYTSEPKGVEQTKLAEAPTHTQKPTAPVVRVEIQNGTTVTGLGVRASQLLITHEEFNVIKVGNAVTRDYTHTVIYDLTNGAKADELQALKTFFQADIASASGWMKNDQVIPEQVAVTPDEPKPLPTGSKVDFLVILGQSARDVVMK